MKYTINGYSQEKLIEHDIDLASSLILRVIADMYTSNSKTLEYKIIDNDKYMWCTYDYLMKQIPILGAERTLVRKIDSLIEKGILKKQVLFQRKGRTGKYVYVSLGENYNSLTEYNTTDKMSDEQLTNCQEGGDKLSLDQLTNCHIKDSSITDSSIVDYKEREKEAEPDPVSNSGGYYQEIRMLLASYKINYEKIARLGKPISRIKEVLRIAKENGKSEGWIVGALTDDYNLEYFYKPREIKKEAAKKKSGKVIDSSEYEDFSEDYFEKYIGKGEEIA